MIFSDSAQRRGIAGLGIDQSREWESQSVAAVCGRRRPARRRYKLPQRRIQLLGRQSWLQEYLERLTKPLDLTKADEAASESQEGVMNVVPAFVADAQAPTAMQPGQGPLDHPAMTAEALARFDATASNARADVALTRVPAAAGEVVTFIGMNLGGAAPGCTAPLTNARHRIQQGGEAQRVVRVGRAEERGERNPAAFHNEVMLRAELAAVRGIRSGLPPPFSAGTAAASRLARDQSIWPALPSWSSSTWCNRDHTPAACQSRSRRQQLIPLPQPISAGRYSHGMPVRSTNNMPVKACRSGSGGRPPFGRAARGGSRGAITAHNSSLTSSFPILAAYPLLLSLPRFC